MRNQGKLNKQTNKTPQNHKTKQQQQQQQNYQKIIVGL